MTSLDELYAEANYAKQLGDIAKATQLYKTIIEKYPNSLESKYAQINIEEMAIHRDRYTPRYRPPVKPLKVFLTTMAYGFVGALIVFVPLFILSISEKPTNVTEAFYVQLFYYFIFGPIVGVGFLVGAIIGFVKVKGPIEKKITR